MNSYILPLAKADLDEDGIHLLLRISINGYEGWAVLDTGASRSAFDEQFLTVQLGQDCFNDTEKISTGLGTNAIKCRFATVSELGIGAVIIRNYIVAALDLSHINHAYKQLGLEEIMGIIGNDILLNYRAVIDYEKFIVTLKVV